MKSRQLSFLLLAILLVYYYRTNAQTATLPAVVDVSAIGAATYSIPIDVVPGTGGMQPSLVITYNSLGGLGNIGYKWSLEGISSISRMPQSLYYDGNVRPISFDTSDRFALDGKRLILLSGSNYHAANAIYGHEVEDFSRIARAWDGLNDYFADTLANGSIAYYGLGTSTRLASSGHTLAWMLCQITDGNGNNIKYEYSVENGMVCISRILYVYDDANPTIPYAQIIFHYESQSPENDYYLSGAKFSQARLLSGISIVYQTDTIRNYRFSYSDISHRPQLTAIQLFDGNDNSLSTTQISWREDSNPLPIVYDDTILGLGRNRFFVSGNFDDNRLYDIFAIGVGQNPQLRIYKQTTSGEFEQTLLSGSFPQNTNYSTLTAADLDGDGVDEIVCRSENGNLHSYHIASIQINNNIQCQTILQGHNLSMPVYGDFDGDGITEFAVLSGNTIHCYGIGQSNDITTQMLSNGYYKLLAGDYDGDGKSELLALSFSGYTIYSLNTSNGLWQQTETGESFSYSDACFVGDFNGDGQSDILHLPDNGSVWQAVIHKGLNQWEVCPIADLDTHRVSGSTTPLYPPIVCDFNGDGRSDILQDITDETTQLVITQGIYNSQYALMSIDTFNRPNWQKISLTLNTIGDFNSNGIPDLIFSTFTGYGNLVSVKHLNGSHIMTPWVKRITNTLGKEILFEYGNISLMPERYEGGGMRWASFPVVKDLLVSDGIGGYDTTSYYYGNACFDEATHSFLGFGRFGVFHNRQMTEQTFVRVIDGNGHKFPLLQPARATTHLLSTSAPSSLPNYAAGQTAWHTDSDTAIMSTSRHISVLQRATASPVSVFLPYVSLDTAIKHLKNSLTITATSLNSQWRPSQQTITIYPNNGNTTAVSFVQNSYQYTATTLSNGARIVQPSRKTEYTAFGTSMIDIINERRDFTDYSYNNQGLLSCIIHYDNGGYCDTTRYTYNSHGLPLRITQTPAGCTSRYTDNQYDPTSRFVVSQTDVEGNSVHASYDGATGLKTSESDINGITTHYEYDALGRLTRLRRPDGTSVQYEYSRITGNFPNAVWSKLESEEMRPSKRTYYDMLGRVVHTSIDGQGYRDIVYNHLGQVVRKTLMPYEQASTPDTNKIWETREYDAYGRPTKTESYYSRSIISYPPAASYSPTNYRYYVCERLKTGAVKTTYYDAAGRVVQVVDNGGTINYRYSGNYNLETFRQKTLIIYGSDTTTIVADSRDHRLSISDPDGGTITSTYDGWGQLTQQTDANGNVTTYTYDALGRIATSRTISSGGMGITLPVRYTYYTTNTATSRRIGKLQKISDAIRTYRTFDYDTLGRLVSETNRISNVTYTQSYSYDSYGRLYTITYPSGFVLRHEYDLLGELDILRNHTTGEQIYYIDRFTYLRQPQRAWYGNNTGVEYEYNAYGLPVRLQYGYKIDSSPRSDPGIDSIGGGGIIGPLHPGDPYSVGNEYSRSLYEYNSRGRIISRYDTKCNQMEDYFYDNLSRLKKVIVNGYQTRTYQYANNGNMTNNSFVSAQAYIYGGDQPHAVTGVTSTSGNIAPSLCQVTYNKFNRPASISEGDYTLSLTCQSSPTLDLAILKKNGTAVCSTLYISRISECEKTAYNTRYIDYIYAGGIPVAIHVKNNFLQTDSIYYVQTDLLGSWERIVDANKQVVQASHFDPWGNRMKPIQWQVSDTTKSFLFRRGFTGHEHYDRFRIINTGARLYDPVTARFFSPDPYVQDPFSTQAFNRYSYCWNNPVMFTDPTGEFVITTAVLVAIGIGAAVGGYVGYTIGKSHGASGWGMVGYIAGGAVIGGISGYAGATAGAAIASAVGASGFIGGAAAGAAGGAVSGAINGAGFTALAGGNASQIAAATLIGSAGGMISGALIGGVVSGIQSLQQGNNFWTGTPKTETIAHTEQITPEQHAIQQSYQKGIEGEQRAINELMQDGYDFVKQQVTVEVNGVKVRLDAVMTKDGAFFLVEVKNGPYAGFTPNQGYAYPLMLEHKVPIIPRGANAAEVWGKKYLYTEITDYTLIIIKYK